MAWIARAPGRINLIGEHTDYNDGWVMPAAIELRARVQVRTRGDSVMRVHSRQFPDTVEFLIGDAAGGATPHWGDTLRGIATLLSAGGAEVEIDSAVPVGAGLSSSAAVEVAFAAALAASLGRSLAGVELALLVQRASHEFGHTRCGIMDMYIAALGREGAIAVLDTRTLEAQWLPWPSEVALVVADTGVRHHHASGGYNRRREECEAAARALGVAALRDASPDASVGPRARHVIGENARVHEAAAALARHDFATLGKLLNASHASLQYDFEVSCPELDALAERCRRHHGVYGARMMGGGFGGCVLALVRTEDVAALQEALETRTWCVHPSSGVSVEGEHACPSPL